MANLFSTLKNYLIYRGGEGYIAFILHRATGLATVLFLVIHIIDTGFVYFAPALYTEILTLYRSTLFGLGEVALVFCVFYHGANGLRIAIFDLYAQKSWNIPFQRSSVRATLAIAIALWLPAAFFMLRSLMIHNFGWFGG